MKIKWPKMPEMPKMPEFPEVDWPESLTKEQGDKILAVLAEIRDLLKKEHTK